MLNRVEEIANTLAAACYAVRENCSLHEAADVLDVRVVEGDLIDKANLLHLVDRCKVQMDGVVGQMKLDLGKLESFRGL